MSTSTKKLMELMERRRRMEEMEKQKEADRGEQEPVTEQNPATKRNSRGQYKKGSSGNPSGRPKRTDIEKAMLAEIYKLAPQAVTSLKKLLEDEETPCNVRLKAVEIVLNRICGTALDSNKLEDYEDKIRFDFGSISETDLVEGFFDSLS